MPLKSISLCFILLLSPCLLLAAPPAPDLPITMLVPGFTVRELPVNLTNINNLEYAPDGRLFAVGYDGRVWVLSDTDGDGLEDTAKLWWSKGSAMRAPIGICLAKEGLYVASKGKVSLLRDTDNDGIADKEEIIQSGWKEIFVAVDSLGVAVDKDNNLYFGRGAANFADAYQRDKQGKPHYNLTDETGCILKVSPDRKSREIVATGVRFSVAIAINRLGDIFWTDQEGDTWTHGNHLDELNVLLPGKRHYGFPERHPEYLPNTLDEPPVVSFGPQHQSTCGLKFNEASSWRKPFGPDFWENDALITGESRGKLWRVAITKTPGGYVGREYLFARTKMLTIDQAVSPDGDLVFCCHSGPPDWGTGPTGKGRLFKIHYADKAAPQPVAAWPAGPREVRVAFNHPLDPAVLPALQGVTIECGEYVRAADRIESMRPPYVVVKNQMQTPRGQVKILARELTDDGQTLVLSTEPLPWRSWYALGIPGVKAVGAPGLGTTVDVDFPLAGVDAQWTAAGQSKPAWSGWLPHLDPAISQTHTPLSPTHQSLRNLLSHPGSLHLHTQLALPGQQATLTLQGSLTKTITLDLSHGPAPLDIQVPTGPNLTLTALYHTNLDPTDRPLPLESLLPPWAPAQRQPLPTPTTKPSALASGDWQKGHDIFFGPKAACSACHTIHGQGGQIGPDLSYLLLMEPDSILHDITDPSARINPDYISYIVDTKDHQRLSGLLRPDGPDHYLLLESANTTPKRLPRSDIAQLTPSPVSLMPQGFGDLGKETLRDLLTFLTTEAPKTAAPR